MHVSPIIGNNILKLDAVDSTNTYASTLLKSQKPTEGLIIQAFHQTSGRGQMGTNWHSPSGESLTFSVILTPTFLKADQQFYLNMAVSLGVFEYLTTKGIADGLIKWPNDIIVQRKKLAGILIENSLLGNSIQHSIVGIGLNVNSPQDSLLKFATSLYAETGRLYNIDAELNEIAHHLDKFYTFLRLGKFELLKEEYMKQLLGHHRPIVIKKGDAEMEVVVTDIQESGRIVLEETNGNWWVAGFKEFEWTY
jgi:BirA family transcriptional regulator, biotin operon repressor / biotin---[acetyl-CoA-carboxylase] ligase